MVSEESYPASEALQVLEGKTISKSGDWWIAVLKVKSQFKTKPQVALYMWRRQGNVWKRKQKFTIVAGNWERIKQAVDEMLRT
jgi:hypothetical protein